MSRVSTIKLVGVIKEIRPERSQEKQGFTVEFKTVLSVAGQEKPTVTRSTREVVMPDWCVKEGRDKLLVGDTVTVMGNIGFSANRTVHIVADKVTIENSLERGKGRDGYEH